MMDSYIRIGAGVPKVRIADPDANCDSIISLIREATHKNCRLLVLPELCVTGYTCGDLFRQPTLLDAARDACIRIAKATEGTDITVAFGAPLRAEGRLFNCGVIASLGKIRGVVPKSYLPSYSEFYERRWFAPSSEATTDEILVGNKVCPFGTDLLFDICGVPVAVEICEDLWVPVSPGSLASKSGALVTLNLSASPESIGKHEYLRNLVVSQSARCRCIYAYSSAGAGESSTDLVFAGSTLIAKDGRMLAEGERFSRNVVLTIADADYGHLYTDRQYMQTFFENQQSREDVRHYRIIDCLPERSNREEYDSSTLLRYVDPHPFVPADESRRSERCREILTIQSAGLVQRLEATGCRRVTIGISGGLDSTLALLVAVRAFDTLGIERRGISGITMPGFGTTGRTHRNATALMRLLGVSQLEIPIAGAVTGHFADIGHDPACHDLTYENCQARERTQILMDHANKTGGMVIGTGDLSELALGWCTYNGDQMSMYGVNASVPKTLVRYLVETYARDCGDKSLSDALLDIAATPISPELIPADENGEIAQKTEDIVGPYELHDFFIYHTLRSAFPPRKIFSLALNAFEGRYDAPTVKKWLLTFYRRFFGQQFKRSCMPDGPKVGSVCLSPRGDWRMPSDASARLWLNEAEAL